MVVMKKIALTIGEPGGIGPEVAIKAAISPEVVSNCHPIIVGKKSIIQRALRLLNLPLKLRTISSPKSITKRSGTIDIIDIQEEGHYKEGQPSKGGGLISYLCIERAVKLALSGEVYGLSTAPISKASLKLAGLPWPGHTEMLAELTSTKDYAMMLVGGGLRVILVTIHTSLRSVPNLLTKKNIFRTILLAKRACLMFGIETPEIAVSGLNPHAGESGMFGTEEAELIKPAIERAGAEGISVSGPYPPDTIFYKALKGEFDIVVCMYHDQGLIPIKLLAFESGVNITVGLPIIRTSPDHGTAFDIAWRGVANPSSMIEAVKLAVTLRRV